MSPHLLFIHILTSCTNYTFSLLKPLCCWWLIWSIQNNAKILENCWNPGRWVLIWEHSARAFQWVPTQHSCDDFHKSLHSCALDESSLRIERVNRLWAIGPLNVHSILVQSNLLERPLWGPHVGLTLVLLVANFAKTNWCQKKLKKKTETLAHGYSFESTLWEISNEYQHDRV